MNVGFKGQFVVNENLESAKKAKELFNKVPKEFKIGSGSYLAEGKTKANGLKPYAHIWVKSSQDEGLKNDLKTAGLKFTYTA